MTSIAHVLKRASAPQMVFSMIGPFILLLAALIPVIAMRDDVWTVGMVAAILAAALAMVAIALPVTNLGRLTRLLRPILILALAAPALWMLLQMIPLPARALANPIWTSAAAALHQPLGGKITVDVGATLLSLAQYYTVVAAALVTAALTLDRQRAAHILRILMVIATLVAMRQIVLEVTSFDVLSLAGEGRAQALVVAVIGVLLSCATAIQAIDQLQQSGRPQRSRTKTMVTLAAAILSLVVCAVAILIPSNPAIIIAALFGVGMLLAVFAIRRWLLGPWGAAGLAAVAAIGLLGAFATIPMKKNADVVTALSTQTQAATEGMLVDVLPAGSGAGTFEALLPIYQDIGTAASQEHPTAAAVITIEMGAIFLAGMVIAALLAAWTLFNRSLSRGQDYVYAGVGASASASLAIMAFANGGILAFSVSLLAGVLFGLAFAQSLSGAARDLVLFELQDGSGEADNRRDERRSAASLTLDKAWPRFALALFGLGLITQAAWILTTERYSQGHFWPSIEQNTASIGARRGEIRKAASVAILRGDLWAESGFALVTQPWTDPGAALDHDDVPGPALNAFARALHFSPHRGDVWLMLAALASRYKLAGYDTAALLKMSYYTAPNELGLLPLRLHVALGTDAGEPELREMIKRDISIVLSRLPAIKPALVAAYNSAPADSKIFVENLISEVDPGYLATMRAK